MRRGHPALVLAALITLLMVGLLDLLTPTDVSFGELYVIPVVLMGWAYGWRVALTFAALGSLTELAVDSSLLRPSEISEPTPILAWNALSSFLAFGVAGVVTDRFRMERERWKAVSAERTRLLRLLEREFPRPLRSIDWFARTFEEALTREVPVPTKLRAQFAGLRHRSRELHFLATDLLRLGRVRAGDLDFRRETFDLGQLTRQAADETLDRNRVVVRSASEGLMVFADPEATRHAISAVIGHLIESSPSEVADVLLRESGSEAAIEFTSPGASVTADDLELSDLLVSANGGRVTVAPRASGARIHVYFPRATAPSAAGMISADVTTRA